jgi:phosphoenolpyruvate carboxylase
VAQCASSLARAGDDDAAHALAQKMTDELTAMPVEEAMPLTRACG